MLSIVHSIVHSNNTFSITAIMHSNSVLDAPTLDLVHERLQSLMVQDVAHLNISDVTDRYKIKIQLGLGVEQHCIDS